MSENKWTLEYKDIVDGVKNYGRESLLTLGNGFIGWRGALITNSYNDDFYPGTYAAGVFNQTSTPVAGEDVLNEDMVNLPNIQLVEIYVDGKLITATKENTKKLNRILDFKTGLLVDTFQIEVEAGKTLDLVSTKVVDPINWHRLGLELQITPNFDNAKIQVKSVIDGSVQNKNVKRYRDFDSQEFDVVSANENILTIKTRTTNITAAMASKTEAPVNGTFENENNKVIENFEFDATSGSTATFKRVMAIATSLETSNNVSEFVAAEVNDSTFESIVESSKNYWQEIWENADVEIDGDDAVQMLTRMNIFHLNQMAQHQANQHLDASVGSRGLTGEGYRGHIFWDELFVLPYYSANTPKTANDVLKYRINRLAAAVKNAESENEKGAMYPWQSGLTGDEQSQLIHLNTVDNTWIPDNSRLQRHVSLAVAYDMWVYGQMTGKIDHLENDGLTMVLAIAKFWINKAQQDGERFTIAGVMGPNEFHEEIPGASTGGLKNNAYTNVMVTWLLNWVDELKKNPLFAESAKKAQLTEEDLDKAEKMRTKLFLSIDKDGIIEQYQGFFNLKQLDFKEYTEKYGDIHRIDRLLKAEGKSPDDYQVIKQADLLMLIYNLGAEQTKELIEQLGYSLPENWLEINTEYYLARTTHGSTTSRPVFAGIYVELARQGNPKFEKTAYEYLVDAIGSDYYDIQGGTTAEGVHMGVMGETLSVIQNDYAGVDAIHGEFRINPRLPEEWNKLKFSQQYKDDLLKFDISKSSLKVTSQNGNTIKVYGKEIVLEKGQEVEVSI